MITGEYLQLCT